MPSEPVPVTLTESEIMVCALCGIMRRVASVLANRRNAHGMPAEADGWGSDIEGACGEYGAAKVIGCCWVPTVNAFGQPDLEGWIEVKTRSKANHDLIVRRNTNPNHAFVLVTGRAPSFCVHGYIIGHDARRPEWWRNHGNRPYAWFVPQSALSDIAELRQR